VSIDGLALYVFYVVLVTLSPGPDILTVIARSVSQGTKAGLVATVGFATGLIYHTTIAATGLVFVLKQSAVAFRVVQYAGAAYLVYLAVRMFMAKDEVRVETGMERRTLGRIFGQSVLMNILNPKVTIFFFAFLSRFAEPGHPWHIVMLGGIFAACTLVCFGGCAVAAGRLTGFLRRRAGAGRVMRYVTAGLFVVLAVSLFFVERPTK
jgi:threonine/homoserine/homoserine lactone efflux protein